MPVLFGRYCVAPVLLAFAREHPQLELDLSFSDRQVDLIADGVDLAVRNGVLGNGAGLQARRITSQRKVLCAAPAYLATKGAPDEIADLATHVRNAGEILCRGTSLARLWAQACAVFDVRRRA